MRYRHGVDSRFLSLVFLTCLGDFRSIDSDGRIYSLIGDIVRPGRIYDMEKGRGNVDAVTITVIQLLVHFHPSENLAHLVLCGTPP